MSGIYKCHDCHMSFGTMQLLNKHKRKFCIGGSIGDPDNLMLRRPLRSIESPPPVSPTESVRRPRHKVIDEKEYSRYNPNQDARAQQLAETHGRQMEYLSLRNRDLEKQRDDIRRRLEQLGTKGVKVDPDNTQQLLEELRAQERRNQLALEELRRQLMNINQPRVNVIEDYRRSEVEKPVIQQPPPPPPPPPQESSRKSYIYPVYYGNSLVAEISALRQAYMQNGGNDIELLDHMSQLQAEAQAIEEAMRKQGMEKQRAPKEKKDVSDHLKTLEFENERLQRELMLLQNLKLKQKNDREDELERELRRLQADHLAKMMGLQNELELLKQRMLLEKPQQIRIETSQPPQPQIPPPPNKHGDNTEIQPWSLQRPYVEVEPMAPYDQYDDDNRFDKQRVPTAFHTWVATQSNKALSREQPFGYPTRDSDKIEG